MKEGSSRSEMQLAREMVFDGISLWRTPYLGKHRAFYSYTKARIVERHNCSQKQRCSQRDSPRCQLSVDAVPFSIDLCILIARQATRFGNGEQFQRCA